MILMMMPTISNLDYDYESKDQEDVLRCNLCDSSRSILIENKDRYNFSISSRLYLSCNLGYLSPRLTHAEYEVFYKETYRPLVSAFHGHQIDHKTIQSEQKEYAEYVLKLLGKYISGEKKYRLLDIGGSTGIVAERIKEYALQQRDVQLSVTILDPSPLELEEARSRDFEGFLGLVEDFEPGDRVWDMILICQTVDHLLDIRKALQISRRLLAEGGYLFLDIVDWQYALEQNQYLRQSIKVDHPFMLARESMIHYFSRAGFEPIVEGRSPSNHLLGFLCQKSVPQNPDPEEMSEHADQKLNFVRQMQVKDWK